MKLLYILLPLLVWLIPPMITRLDIDHRWRVIGSLGSLLASFLILVAIMFGQFGWTGEFWVSVLISGLFCGLVLLFTIEFLRNAREKNS